MAKKKILYLDDEAESVSSLVRLFNSRSSDLEIFNEHPKKFSAQLETLRTRLPEFAALILDLRLDQKPDQQTNEAADYRAMSLAQELRTLAFERSIPDLPIFLWSVENKYEESYYDDDTGHDLFDLPLLKTNLQDHVAEYDQQISSFINCYETISQFKSRDGKNIFELLGLSVEFSEGLDIRFVARANEILAKSPMHTISRFLFRKLVKRPGLLIGEKELAAFLGVDLELSTDWESLKARIPNHVLYAGPLGDGWKRWWAFLLTKWWEEIAGDSQPLLGLPADQRVGILKERTGFENLVIQEPIISTYSTYYSTICCCLRRPLDPVDGFVVAENAREVWSQPIYVSKEVLLNRAKHNFEMRLEPNEEMRFETSKEQAQSDV